MQYLIAKAQNQPAILQVGFTKLSRPETTLMDSMTSPTLRSAKLSSFSVTQPKTAYRPSNILALLGVSSLSFNSQNIWLEAELSSNSYSNNIKGVNRSKKKKISMLKELQCQRIDSPHISCHCHCTESIKRKLCLSLVQTKLLSNRLVPTNEKVFQP